MATEKSSGGGLRFERWVLLSTVIIVSVTTALLAIYSLGESSRICRAVDRGNNANRQAWAFVEQTIRGAELPRTPYEKKHPTKEQRSQDIFFDGIHERLQPVQC